MRSNLVKNPSHVSTVKTPSHRIAYEISRSDLPVVRRDRSG